MSPSLTVKLDGTDLTNTYANVCNVSNLQEGVVLVFGMNNAWEREAVGHSVGQCDQVVRGLFRDDGYRSSANSS